MPPTRTRQPGVIRKKNLVPPPPEVPVAPPPRTRRISEETLQQRYLAGLPKFFTVSGALTAAGVTMEQLRRWRERDGAFLVQEQDARNTMADRLEQEAVRRAFKGIRVPVYQGGLLAGHMTQFSDALLTLLLKAMRPEKYRDRADIQVTQPIIKVVAGFDPVEAL